MISVAAKNTVTFKNFFLFTLYLRNRKMNISDYLKMTLQNSFDTLVNHNINPSVIHVTLSPIDARTGHQWWTTLSYNICILLFFYSLARISISFPASRTKACEKIMDGLKWRPVEKNNVQIQRTSTQHRCVLIKGVSPDIILYFFLISLVILFNLIKKYRSIGMQINTLSSFWFFHHELKICFDFLNNLLKKISVVWCRGIMQNKD